MAKTKKQKKDQKKVREHNQKAAQVQQYTAKLERERRTLMLKMDQLDNTN